MLFVLVVLVVVLKCEVMCYCASARPAIAQLVERRTVDWCSDP